MTYTTERYIAALTAADEHRLQVETRSYNGEELRQQLDERRKALAEAHRVVGGMAWQPIDTAPCFDVLALVCWRDGNVTVEDLDHDSDPAWWAERGATHWMRRPEPPNA